MRVKTLEDEVIERIISIWLTLLFGINRSDGGLMLETSTWKLFMVVTLHYQLSRWKKLFRD